MKQDRSSYNTPPRSPAIVCQASVRSRGCLLKYSRLEDRMNALQAGFQTCAACARCGGGSCRSRSGCGRTSHARAAIPDTAVRFLASVVRFRYAIRRLKNLLKACGRAADSAGAIVASEAVYQPRNYKMSHSAVCPPPASQNTKSLSLWYRVCNCPSRNRPSAERKRASWRIRIT